MFIQQDNPQDAFERRLKKNFCPTVDDPKGDEHVRLYEVSYFDRVLETDMSLCVRARTCFQAVQLMVGYYAGRKPDEGQVMCVLLEAEVTALKTYPLDVDVPVGAIPWRETWAKLAGVL